MFAKPGNSKLVPLHAKLTKTTKAIIYDFTGVLNN